MKLICIKNEKAIYKYKGKYYADTVDCSKMYKYYKYISILDITIDTTAEQATIDTTAEQAYECKWDRLITFKHGNKHREIDKVNFHLIGDDDLSLMEFLGRI